MKAYTVTYKLHSSDAPRKVCVLANNKGEAYVKAVYEVIPQVEELTLPYSAWVTSVTYNNGNYKEFNTFEGNPY